MKIKNKIITYYLLGFLACIGIIYILIVQIAFLKFAPSLMSTMFDVALMIGKFCCANKDCPIIKRTNKRFNLFVMISIFVGL